ncbi:response regulator transcription factor [Anabaena azotica]|uniref:Response regulator transcription factor n=1 Tax=Anabaena azotica FACHB-119 TaxID=947527 RepID=A0ABR8D9Q5_9NOST|nr:response regulator transcription factor [Anabaena azotica]MBD2503940.1 response regulator transcription factor [Anabaena azotica FACHB-119]
MKVPKSEYAAIAAAYNNGLSQSAIASRYHVSHVAIGKILRKIGHPTRMGNSPFYQEEIKSNHDYIVQAYKQGHSYTKIAEDLEINNSTVIWVLQKAGVWHPSERELDQNLLLSIASSYNLGIGIAAIKKRFSCSEGTVYFALSHHKVEIRPRGFAQKARGMTNAIRFNELLKLGYSFQEIAEELNFSEKHIKNMVSKYFPT